MTGDLVAWLREQIAEDRRVIERNTGDDGLARGYPDYRTYVDDDTRAADDYIECFGPKRMLAQCDAHTSLVDRCVRLRDVHTSDDFTAYRFAKEVMQTLGLAYQHRPGYREEWRP